MTQTVDCMSACSHCHTTHWFWMSHLETLTQANWDVTMLQSQKLQYLDEGSAKTAAAQTQ